VENSLSKWQYILGYQLPTNLPATDIVYVNDHYDPIQLEQLIGQQQSWIVSDFHWQLPYTNRPFLCYPYFLIALCNQAKQEIKPCYYDTTSCFNFMVYKVRPLRRVFLELLQYFNLSTSCYTANTGEYMKPLSITHSDPDIMKFLKYRKITPLTLSPRIISTSIEQGYNVSHYSTFLERNVFGPSAIALITEPIEPAWDDSMNFSEKTIFAMLGCNLPIWIGGVNQASLWASAGFDTFDDVIDHSYQTKATTIERMYYAIKNNLELLSNLNLAQTTRNKLHDRLLANQQRVFDNVINTWAESNLSKVPNNIRQGVNSCVQSFASDPT
jgi:hypothetical protein